MIIVALVYFVGSPVSGIEMIVLLQGVMQVERRLGGCLLDKPKQMLYQFGGANLCLSIEDVGVGWRCKQAANYQVSRQHHTHTHTRDDYSSMEMIITT